MSTPPAPADIFEEIAALHRFFVAWFSGTCEESDEIFQTEFLERFDPHFVLIPPAGKLLTLPGLADSIRPRHGSNPEFGIDIRNVVIRRTLPGHVLATYEEWQHNAIASTPRNNGRIATVLLQTRERLRWVHVHETRIPQPI